VCWRRANLLTQRHASFIHGGSAAPVKTYPILIRGKFFANSNA
jgi:hypothetical protein